MEKKIIPHSLKGKQIAELISDTILLQTSEDGLDLLGDLYYQGFDSIILYKKNITPDFFDLKNGMAGEILQKFSTYKVGLAIVGDFTVLTSKSIKDFLYESNKNRHINFTSSLEEALNRLSGG